jgi:hypothetical protein
VNIARLINPIVQRVGNGPRARRVLDEELKAFLGLSTYAHKYDAVRANLNERGEKFAIDTIVAECRRRMKEEI